MLGGHVCFEGLGFAFFTGKRCWDLCFLILSARRTGMGGSRYGSPLLIHWDGNILSIMDVATSHRERRQSVDGLGFIS